MAKNVVFSKYLKKSSTSSYRMVYIFLFVWQNRDSGATMNVEEAWKAGFTGKDIVVSILDDGIEHDHPDLKKNYVSHNTYPRIMLCFKNSTALLLWIGQFRRHFLGGVDKSMVVVSFAHSTYALCVCDLGQACSCALDSTSLLSLVFVQWNDTSSLVWHLTRRRQSFKDGEVCAQWTPILCSCKVI